MRNASVNLLWVGLLALLLGFNSPAHGDSLDEVERRDLERYLQALKAGQPGSAAEVDRLADLPFSALREVMIAYAGLAEPIAGHTHWAFQTLLERMSRTTLVPWPLITTYSPELAEFLTGDIEANQLSQQLFARLMASRIDRRSYDLAVALTPEASLRELAGGKSPHTAALLEAWNRRLSRGHERRPIHQLDRWVLRVAQTIPAKSSLAAHLRFIAAWPAHRELYRQRLEESLASSDAERVAAGLVAQQHAPQHLELNEALLARFPQVAALRQDAIRNFALDDTTDHSATLRRIWESLPPNESKERYNCLLSMGVHWRGNDETALAAVLEEPFAYIDVSMPVLERGQPQLATRAVKYMLGQSKRGHEEALRLARRMKLSGFSSDAVRIAADDSRDQVLRQSAMNYLQLSAGQVRRELLPLLAHKNADLRLCAIQMFAEREGLTPADMDDIGPTLIRVAQADPSLGHRQEAAYALGKWRAVQTKEFFDKLLVDYPAVTLLAGHYNDEHYWHYRMRLVALLGLAQLGNADARTELLELHRTGGPTERMDVLLAFDELGEVPAAAFDDLRSLEPKLVATAAHLIGTHGDAAARKRLREAIGGSPLWLEFRHSGLDDHNVLEMAMEE